LIRTVVITKGNGVCESIDVVCVGGGVALDAVIDSGEKIHVGRGKSEGARFRYDVYISNFPRLDHDVDNRLCPDFDPEPSMVQTTAIKLQSIETPPKPLGSSKQRS
jgi:hypothetical protein